MSIIPKNVRLFLLPMTNFPPLKGDTMSTENVCPVLAHPYSVAMEWGAVFHSPKSHKCSHPAWH